MKPIKILIADDHQLVAESLSLLLGTVEGFEITGIVNNGWQAIDFTDKFPIDILLADYHMPLLNGVELITKLSEKSHGVKTIMLTMSENPENIKDSIQAGVYGYVMKSAEKPELVNAIKTVHDGQKYFSEKIVRKLAEIPNENAVNGKLIVQDIQSLTKREIEIVRLVAEDLSNTEIGNHLNISSTTVETHRRNLMKKIGVSTAVGMVRWGLRHGVVDGI